MDESKLLKADLQKLVASQRQQISVLKNTILGLERQIEDLQETITNKQVEITSLTNANNINEDYIESVRTSAREELAKEYDAFVNRVKTQTDNLLVEHAHIKEGLIKYDRLVQALRNQVIRQQNDANANTQLLFELVDTVRSVYVTEVEDGNNTIKEDDVNEHN
jgi:predicted  nucleic acid-binding Zn-ribbon protein